MNNLSLFEYFIVFISITFIFWGGYLIGVNKDKLFPQEDEKTLKELDLELEEALEIEDYEQAIKITKKIEKRKNE